MTLRAGVTLNVYKCIQHICYNVTGGATEMCARLRQINKVIGKGEAAIGWGMFICVLYTRVVYKRIRNK